MRVARLLFLLLFVFSFCPRLNSQQSVVGVQRDPQAVALVTKAQSALTNGNPVTDLALSGTASWFLGSTTATGTSATLRAKGTAESRLDIYGQFMTTEIRNYSAQPDGEVINADGVVHHMAIHNCWVPAGWFAPLVTIQSAFNADAMLRYVGLETWNGLSVAHLQLFRSGAGQIQSQQRVIQSLSAVDIYLDVSTHLPLSITFNSHPDDDYSRNIPVEVRFSDYRAVDGVNVPFRIQRLIAGNLNADITISSVSVNSGLSDNNFQLQ